jgi:hypothetical protein
MTPDDEAKQQEGGSKKPSVNANRPSSTIMSD